ncbi:MAG: hypothetical protein HQK63_17380, partial [Desulfamplus sp.]|nr:hypothetical protein [Desulfamplus sp.]
MENTNYINEVSIIKCDKENHYIYISDKFIKDIDSTGIDKDVVDKFIDNLKSITDPFKYGESIKHSNL